MAVREEDQRGGRGGWAGEGEAAPGGGMGSRGSRRGAAACQPQPGADAGGLGLGVATAAAVCAAAGTEGARDGHGVERGGRGGAGPLREVGRVDEGGAGEARDPPLQRPGRQGREAKERGPEMEEGWWRRMLGEALPGMSLHCPREQGKKPRVSCGRRC